MSLFVKIKLRVNRVMGWKYLFLFRLFYLIATGQLCAIHGSIR